MERIKIRRAIGNEKGSALVLTLFLLTFVGIVSAAMIFTWEQSNLTAHSLKTNVQTHYLLEAGVADVQNFLDQNIQTQTGKPDYSSNQYTIDIQNKSNDSSSQWLTKFESKFQNYQTQNYSIQITGSNKPQNFTDQMQTNITYHLLIRANNRTLPLSLTFHNALTGNGDPFPTNIQNTAYSAAYASNFSTGINNNNKKCTIINTYPYPKNGASIVQNSVDSAISAMHTNFNNMLNNVNAFDVNHQKVTKYSGNAVPSTVGNTHIMGDLNSISGSSKTPFTVNGDLLVDGSINSSMPDIQVNGNLYVKGNINCSSIHATGDIFVIGSVNGNVSDLTVGGNLYVEQDLNASALDVSGTINVGGSINGSVQRLNENVPINTFSLVQDVVVGGSFSPSFGKGNSESKIGGTLYVKQVASPSVTDNAYDLRIWGDFLAEGNINFNGNGNGHTLYTINGHLASNQYINVNEIVQILNNQTPLSYGGNGNPVLSISSFSYAN